MPFRFKPITRQMLCQAAATLRVNLRGPPSEIPSAVLKQAMPIFSEALLYIFNLSLSTGTFPESLKLSEVIPLLKPKKPAMELNSYRPIALSSFLSKLFEKCVKSQLVGYLNNVEFFSPSQHGFMKGRSCDTAICNLYDFITHKCEGGNGALVGFLDVAKAFDSLSHEIFDKLLCSFDFDATVRLWFQSFLSNRRIRVRVGSACSCEFAVPIGVPQGSSLSPLIFAIYINTVLEYIALSSTLSAFCYADDLSVGLPINKENSYRGISSFMIELQNLVKVYDALGLTLNIQKTEVVLFKNSHSQIIRPPSLLLGSSHINLSSGTSCLGITLGENLDWHRHFISIRQKCYSAIAALNRLRKVGLPLDALLTCYHALFVPILTYGIMVWGGAFQAQLRVLQVIQRDALRTIFGLPRHAGVVELMSRHRILGLNQLFVLRVSCAVHKQLAADDQLPSTTKLQVKPPGPYPLRNYHTSNVVTAFERREYGVRSPRCQHARIWNGLPACIRGLQNFSRFRASLREHVQTQVPPFGG